LVLDNKKLIDTPVPCKPIECVTCRNYDAKTIFISDPTSGEIICQNCGQVVSERTTQTLSGTLVNGLMSNSPGRSSIVSLAHHDGGLATRIGLKNKDASGHLLTQPNSSRFGRLRTWDARLYADNPKYRNLQPAFNKLLILKDKLGLSDAAVERTAYIYRKAQENGLVQGRTVSAIVAAIIYWVFKEMEAFRTLGEISEASDVKRKEIAKAFRILVYRLDLRVPAIDPMKNLAKVANKANVSEKTKRQAISIMYSLIKKGITAGKDPSSLAATALYLASKDTGENITQKDLAAASGKSEVTVRMRLKEIRRYYPIKAKKTPVLG